ncbi:unnamed protein product [Sphagnum balticum]
MWCVNVENIVASTCTWTVDNQRSPNGTYIRLSDTTPIDDVMEIIHKAWRFEKNPSLVISVIGGSDDFELNDKVREIVIAGLVQAALSTNAWIITSGLHEGVTRAVGEAGRWSTIYRGVSLGLDSLVSLDTHHTNFIFVDDGYRNSFRRSAADFQLRLEKRITDINGRCNKTSSMLAVNTRLYYTGGQRSDNEHHTPLQNPLHTPVVVVLVGGGLDAIDRALESIECGIPLIVCKDTYIERWLWRAANIIAYAYDNFLGRTSGRMIPSSFALPTAEVFSICPPKSCVSESTDDSLEATRYEIGSMLDNVVTFDRARVDDKKFTVDERIARIERAIKECCAFSSLVTIFDINVDTGFDSIILSIGKGKPCVSSVAKVWLSTAGTHQNPLNQMRFASKLNRSDVTAKEIVEICGDKTDKLHERMHKALIANKVTLCNFHINKQNRLHTCVAGGNRASARHSKWREHARVPDHQ